MQNAERAEILRCRYSPRQILALMGRFDFAVGMRLHFMIFAALRGTPFAALPYATKVTGLLEDLEMDTPPLGNISIGQLIASIDHSWDRRDQIRAKIQQQLPGLKSRAMQTNEFLVGPWENDHPHGPRTDPQHQRGPSLHTGTEQGEDVPGCGPRGRGSLLRHATRGTQVVTCRNCRAQSSWERGCSAGQVPGRVDPPGKHHAAHCGHRGPRRCRALRCRTRGALA